MVGVTAAKAAPVVPAAIPEPATGVAFQVYAYPELELVAAKSVATEVVPQEEGLLFVNEIDGGATQFKVTGKRSVIQVPVFVATYQDVVAVIAAGV